MELSGKQYKIIIATAKKCAAKKDQTAEDAEKSKYAGIIVKAEKGTVTFSVLDKYKLVRFSVKGKGLKRDSFTMPIIALHCNNTDGIIISHEAGRVMVKNNTDGVEISAPVITENPSIDIDKLIPTHDRYAAAFNPALVLDVLSQVKSMEAPIAPVVKLHVDSSNRLKPMYMTCAGEDMSYESVVLPIRFYGE
jgi:hypothetical protein